MHNDHQVREVCACHQRDTDRVRCQIKCSLGSFTAKVFTVKRILKSSPRLIAFPGYTTTTFEFVFLLLSITVHSRVCYSFILHIYDRSVSSACLRISWNQQTQQTSSEQLWSQNVCINLSIRQAVVDLITSNPACQSEWVIDRNVYSVYRGHS